MQQESRRRCLLAVLAVAALATASALALAGWRHREALPPLAEARAAALALLQAVPAPGYFAAFVVLPAAGVPLSLFYLTALPVLGAAHPAAGVLLAWLAVGLNMALMNLLARGLLHPAIERVIRRRGLRIPKLRPDNEWPIVLATRLSPLPWALQNYLLALGHARWRTYLWLSLPIQGAIGLAMMLVGKSVLKGSLGYLLLAVCGLLLLHLAFKGLRRRLRRAAAELPSAQ